VSDIPNSPEDKEGDAALQKWLNAELLAQGPDVVLHPLAGWSCATRPDNYVLLGLGYLTKSSTREAHILRLAMTRSQALRLSKGLENLARTPHAAAPDKPN
jgi:hypothetical protein